MAVCSDKSVGDDDWLEQRNDDFSQYIPIGNKDAKSGDSTNVIFKTYYNGIATSRDAWVYNSSKIELSKNMKRHIDYCNGQNLDNPKINPKEAKWTGDLSKRLKKETPKFHKNKIRVASYRPFFKQYLYFDHIFNHRIKLAIESFPENNSENLVICVTGKILSGFSTFLTNITPDLEVVHHSQCFPLYVYENNKKKSNISDDTLKTYQTLYNKKITKEDIFYYVYGAFHYPQYKKKYANNLSKELPQIPMFKDFKIFSDVGCSLAKLHLNYESDPRYKLDKAKFKPKKFEKISFGNKKQKFESGKEKTIKDRTVLKVDNQVIFENIPEVNYKVNGRTPIEWLVDRYNIVIDKDSGIKNNPCIEVDIIPLIERLVHVGVESDKLIALLPKKWDVLDWKPKKSGLDQFAEGGEFQSKL